MTDQRILAGIGNAYSDEILFRARISPMRQIRHLTMISGEIYMPPQCRWWMTGPSS